MIIDSFRLTGKIAVVTGCSTGLGQGMCLGLAEAGADIVQSQSLAYIKNHTKSELLARMRTAATAVARLRSGIDSL